jgi:hypothetical protein
MRNRQRYNAAPLRDDHGRPVGLDRRVEAVTQQSLDEMVCTLARRANERFLQHV